MQGGERIRQAKGVAPNIAELKVRRAGQSKPFMLRHLSIQAVHY
jgi:hypothetical protein